MPVYRLGFDIGALDRMRLFLGREGIAGATEQRYDIYHLLLKYPDPYPTHERVVRVVIQDYWADVPVLLPSDIASELREYERTSRVS